MLMCSAELIGGLCKEQSAQADPAAAQAARSGLDGAAAMGMRSQQPQKRPQLVALQNPHGVAGARPRGTLATASPLQLAGRCLRKPGPLGGLLRCQQAESGQLQPPRRPTWGRTGPLQACLGRLEPRRAATPAAT